MVDKNSQETATTNEVDQVGKQGIAVLECLRKNGRKNRLDIEMMLGQPLEPLLVTLHRLGYVVRGLYGATVGCYEITPRGRTVLSNTLSLPIPAYAPIAAGTMRETYVPSLHNRSQNRVSL